eukprot:744765-Hanusia_phi.AAC.1
MRPAASSARNLRLNSKFKPSRLSGPGLDLACHHAAMIITESRRTGTEDSAYIKAASADRAAA